MSSGEHGRMNVEGPEGKQVVQVALHKGAVTALHAMKSDPQPHGPRSSFLIPWLRVL